MAPVPLMFCAEAESIVMPIPDCALVEPDNIVRSFPTSSITPLLLSKVVLPKTTEPLE